MKNFLLIIILFTNIFAQLDPQEYVDKSKNAIGKEKVNLLIQAAKIFRDLSQIEQAINYAENALNEADSSNYIEGKIDAENTLANTYLLANQLDKGISYTRSAFSSSEKFNYKAGLAAAYRNIGIYQIFSNRPKLAIDTLNISAEQFSELKDSSGLAATYTSMGVAFTRLNEIDKSIECFEKSAELFLSQQNNYRAAHAYLNMGSIYSSIINDLEKGLTYSLEALHNFQIVGDEFKSAYAMTVIGTAYEGLGEYEKAVDYYSQALEVFEKSGNVYVIANVINNLGEAHKNMREYNKAIDYYTQALEESKKINHDEGIAVALNNIGECYFDLGNNALALDYYSQSHTILTKLNDKHKIAISLNNQADVYLNQKNYIKTLAKVNKALKLAVEVKSREEELKSYELIYKAQKGLNNYKEAFISFTKYEELKDSLFYEQKSDELARALAEQDALQKEKEIALLTKDAELKEAELSRQETLSYMLIAISMLLLIFTIVYYVRLAERKAMNKKLIQSERELKEINKTKDLFFSIIAHDLKGPFNSLLGITEMLAEDTKDLSIIEIENLSKEVNSNARNVYLLLENLLEWSSSQLGKRSFNPAKFDLNEIVSQNINLYRKAASTKEINVNASLDNYAFVHGDKNMIDSVVRNLLNNAIKFTKRNGKINITTSKKEESILLSVKDNGIGISQSEVEKIFTLSEDVKKEGTENEKGTGLGLILSKEFVEKNNGKIEVISKKGEGTEFKIELPSSN